MRRLLLLLPLLALLLPALPAGAQSPPGPSLPQDSARVTQVDSSHYPDVTIYVSVTDASGQPVSGLAARDFTVTEDGQPVTIGGFGGGGGGAVSTALVIDRSGSMAEADKIDGAQEAARAFVEQMRPGDRTALIAFNSEARTVQNFTASQADLVESIARIRPEGGTALYDAMVAGVDALKSAGGRRALLLLTDGQDCRDSSSCPDWYGSQRSLDEAISYAARQGQPIYAIGLGDRAGGERDGIDEAVLQRIARETGGEYFYAPSGAQLAGLYRKLSSDIQQEYALTYRSPRPFYDGTRRDIRVSVGGAPSAAGGYVERHLIDVRSSPLVGALLLLPILGALLLPSLLRRRRTKDEGRKTNDQRPTTNAGQPEVNIHPPTSYDQPPFATGTPAFTTAPALGSTIVQAPSVVVIPPDVARCTSCDAPLLRPGARFCSECGAPQAQAHIAAPRRIFCDQCGRPMRAGAQFCSNCGATAPVTVEMGARG